MIALNGWHRDFPGLLAGSVYSTPDSRVAAAQTLADTGLDVHVDVMAASEGLPVGVSLAELQMISSSVDRARIGVHLIGSADFVDAVLPKILALHPGVVFLPWEAFTAERTHAIRAAGGAAWIAVWREWDGLTDPQWPAEPDGVLVMLIEPGTKDRCRLERLSLVTACTTRSPLPVAVDGGVTEEIAPLCAAAGVSQMIVGRALLTSERREAI
ncbi:ribulose phosphate epimerase [Mycobacterium hodleri]|uniref:ribulose phosphate epimerase n=1 Tax=Mycolicibacterium hodleri TaxID=49897 RepID=UPI0021F34129|nr:ribulose phosphate epimerase [Mycolicibacterium hodleri]MCV7134528.1 ribulose phosphate epimerase [Mycolicibacterium hodleri]